jgi:hypothetical protein
MFERKSVGLFDSSASASEPGPTRSSRALRLDCKSSEMRSAYFISRRKVFILPLGAGYLTVFGGLHDGEMISGNAWMSMRGLWKLQVFRASEIDSIFLMTWLAVTIGSSTLDWLISWNMKNSSHERGTASGAEAPFGSGRSPFGFQVLLTRGFRKTSLASSAFSGASGWAFSDS